jgi:PAS domain S-box-containing protein
MPENQTNKFLADLIPVASSGINKDEISKYFIDVIRNSFGIEQAKVSEIAGSEPQSTIGGYILSTKKPYVDNQLSEYSSFPELISYKNNGYRSYAALPMMADGKVVSLLEMFSSTENKFSPDVVKDVSVGALLVGFALAYKSEVVRSNRLAGYFDAVFDADIPQMLVSADGKIVKANRSAIKELSIVMPGASIDAAIGIGPEKLLPKGTGAYSKQKIIKGGKLYSTFSSRINERLFCVSLNEVTAPARLEDTLKAAGSADYSIVIFTDPDMNILDATGNFEKMLGYSKNIMTGKNISDIISEKEKSQLISGLAGIKENETFVSKNADLATIDGRSIHTHISAYRSCVGYSLIFSVAEAEKYVGSLRAALDDFIDNTSDMVFEIDDLGFIKNSNMPVERILGYNRDSINGKEFKNLYKDQAVLDRDIAYARNNGKPDNSYVDLLAKDGRVVPATHSIRMLADAGGTPSYRIIIKELETKRRLNDQEMQIKERDKVIKRLSSTGDLKSQFIYNISHELKTPMTNIKGFSKLIYDGEFGSITDEQKEYLETILKETDRLMLIIQQVLDAAKLDANKVKLELKEVDVSTLNDNPSIKALEEAAREKGLAFLWKADYDVPKVLADPNRLIQIFVNLIGNAIKFTDAGSISVRILKKSKKSLECHVIDTGIGISDEDKQKLFKKFYQVPKNSSKELVKQDGSGTGLGLSITRELVRLHGGKIFIDSKPGNGSDFGFTLKVNPRRRQKSQQHQ